jgi:hypothetical protein
MHDDEQNPFSHYSAEQLERLTQMNDDALERSRRAVEAQIDASDRFRADLDRELAKARTSATALSRQELAICAETGCDPKVFAHLRSVRDGAVKGNRK